MFGAGPEIWAHILIRDIFVWLIFHAHVWCCKGVTYSEFQSIHFIFLLRSCLTWATGYGTKVDSMCWLWLSSLAWTKWVVVSWWLRHQVVSAVKILVLYHLLGRVQWWRNKHPQIHLEENKQFKLCLIPTSSRTCPQVLSLDEDISERGGIGLCETKSALAY